MHPPVVVLQGETTLVQVQRAQRGQARQHLWHAIHKLRHRKVAEGEGRQLPQAAQRPQGESAEREVAAVGIRGQILLALPDVQAGALTQECCSAGEGS